MTTITIGATNRARKFATATVALALAAVCVGRAAADGPKSVDRSFTITVDAGKHDRTATPVSIELAVPASFTDRGVELVDPEGHTLVGQLTPPGLANSKTSPSAASPTVPCELHFVLPKLAAGKSLELRGRLMNATTSGAKPTAFQWKEVPNDRIRLSLGDRPVMDYIDAAYDNSSPAERDKTLKVYDHLYDPVDGARLVTKGQGGLYTHHRGLFYGFQRVSYGPKNSTKVNIWECPNAHQSHEGVLSSEAGPVLARHLLAIDWHGPEEKTGPAGPVFAHETREMTVYNVPGGTMIDFVSVLRTAEMGPVRLDGDPQHAGFQFRASQEVAANTHSQTIYIRPDGVGKPGETRNWAADPKKRDLGCVNLPWKGMSFVLGDQRYTAALLDRPDNPKEARYSERDYGRFGSYFEYNLTEAHPLKIRYRFWLQRGQATQQQIAAMDDDFVAPVVATVETP